MFANRGRVVNWVMIEKRLKDGSPLLAKLRLRNPGIFGADLEFVLGESFR